MESHHVDDLEVIFDCAGRNDWGKFSFPVWYGIPVKIKWRSYTFDFNLQGRLKRITGSPSVWPDPTEMLKRTESDDFVYYGTDGYELSYDLLKNYYLPYSGKYESALSDARPLESAHVAQALSTFDCLCERAGRLASAAGDRRLKKFLATVAAMDRKMLAQEAGKLHSIIGGSLPVLPPDIIDVDYEVIPLMVTEGCDYQCRFCCFKTADGLKARSRSNIARQVKALRDLYGEDLVNYNSLVLGQNDALGAGEELLRETAETAYAGLRLGESCHGGAPNLFLFGSVGSFMSARESCFDILNALPFSTRINIGLESPDQATLDILGKPLKAVAVTEAFRKAQAVNRRWPNIDVTVNFVLGTDLPLRHLKAVRDLIADAAPCRDKGAVYLSPLIGAATRRQVLEDFRKLKRASALPVYLYLVQSL
ncbi:MAG: radical SAM protein [Deltaproteobacteria bacterium]|nr:radical SAM protein [Deltaproteobacteria bacterium]